MFAELNLATEPFRNRALPLALAALIACASLFGFAYIATEVRAANNRADAFDSDLRGMRRDVEKLRLQSEAVRQSLTPEESRSLDAAHLLLDRKHFSWSRLFADLESATPSDVRVSRIGVKNAARVGDETRAELELTVIGRTPTDVTDMINEMDRTGIFNAEPLTENPRTNKGDAGVEWTLRVLYTQRGGASSVARRERSAPNNAASDEENGETQVGVNKK